MPKRATTTQVVVVSDLHVGSTLGLCKPVVYLDDGQEYRANRLQQEAWDYWTNVFWKQVWQNKKKGIKTVVVANGDLVDSQHHGTVQVFSSSIMDHINHAAEILDPIREKADAFFVTRGTPAHVMASGAADEQIARQIKATKANGNPGGVRSSYHLKLNIDGVLFDIAHQGPNPGYRMWTRGNTVRAFVRTIVLDALVTGNRPPDALVRSHVHSKVHETCRDYGHVCEAYITPAFQWKTEYAHQIASHESIADVGGLIVTISGGRMVGSDFHCLPLSQTDYVEV